MTAATATNTAPVTMSPCASASTRVRRWTSVKPSAISPYAAPVASPVTSAWTATGKLTSRDGVPDPELPRAEGDDLDVDRVLAALHVRLGLGARLLIGGEQLVAGGLQRLDGVVALLRQLLGVAVDGGEVLRGLAERALRVVDVRALDDLDVARRLLLGLRVEVADFVAVLAAGLLGLLLLLLLLLVGLALLTAAVLRRRGRRGLRAGFLFVVVAAAGEQQGERRQQQGGESCSRQEPLQARVVAP